MQTRTLKRVMQEALELATLSKPMVRLEWKRTCVGMLAFRSTLLVIPLSKKKGHGAKGLSQMEQ